MKDTREPQGGATTIHCDSESAIAISKNPVFHRMTKHIKVKYHFIREAQDEREVELVKIKEEEQLVDNFTKALPKGRFEIMRDMLGMRDKNSRRSVKL